MDIAYLITNLASVITYLASGFIFIKVLLYVRNSEDNASHNSHYVLPSVVISYVIKLIVDLVLSSINVKLSENVFWFILLVVAAISGFICGKISKSKFAEKSIVKLFHRSTKIGFWDDIPGTDRYYTIKYKGSETLYQGCIFDIEGDSKYPLIKLCRYSVYNSDTDEIEDYTNDNDNEIILHTENIEYIRSASIGETADSPKDVNTTPVEGKDEKKKI